MEKIQNINDIKKTFLNPQNITNQHNLGLTQDVKFLNEDYIEVYFKPNATFEEDLQNIKKIVEVDWEEKFIENATQEQDLNIIKKAFTKYNIINFTENATQEEIIENIKKFLENIYPACFRYVIVNATLDGALQNIIKDLEIEDIKKNKLKNIIDNILFLKENTNLLNLIENHLDLNLKLVLQKRLKQNQENDEIINELDKCLNKIKQITINNTITRENKEKLLALTRVLNACLENEINLQVNQIEEVILSDRNNPNNIRNFKTIDEQIFENIELKINNQPNKTANLLELLTIVNEELNRNFPSKTKVYQKKINKGSNICRWV